MEQRRFPAVWESPGACGFGPLAASDRSTRGCTMAAILKFFGSVIGIIFLIGLLVVIGLLALIF